MPSIAGFGMRPALIRAISRHCQPASPPPDQQAASPRYDIDASRKTSGRQDRDLAWHRGTSGEPFTLARSWHEERFLTVVRTLALRGLGFHARLRQARIRVPADFDWLKDRPLRLLNTVGFYRSRIFSCFDPPELLWGSGSVTMCLRCLSDTPRRSHGLRAMDWKPGAAIFIRGLFYWEASFAHR